MENKTCGECQWYDYHHLLCVVGGDVEPTDCACDSFIPIKRTNGDVIRQMSNEELAEEFVDMMYDRVAGDYRYYSMLTGEFYNSRKEAIAATVAKLKEVYNER